MSKKNKNNMGINNTGSVTVGNDLNQKFNKSNQNQIDKSVTIIQQTIKEPKPINSLENMSNRDGLEVKYTYNKNGKFNIDTKAIINVQGYAVKFIDVDKTFKSEFTGKLCVRLLVINIHQQIPSNGWQYKCDHIHLSVPDELIDENLEGRLINIKGFVYPYAKDTKRSIEATDVKIVRDEYDKEDEPQKIKINRNFNFDSKSIEKRVDCLIENKFNRLYKRFDEVERLNLLNKSIYLLELCLNGNFYDEFITNYIVTQYTCNFSPSLVRELSYKTLLKHPVSSANVTIIINALVYDIIHNEITTIPELFERITGYVNWALDLYEDNIISDETVTRLENMKSLEIFRERIYYISENLELLSAYRFAKLRNENFGYHFAHERLTIAKAMEIIFNEDFDIITQNIRL